MARSSEAAHEAILFMAANQVQKQFRLSEFEALLDGVVTLSDLADQEVTAVYVQLDKSLNIIALVFFLLYFDEEGRADSEWNLPLQRLAKISGAGPDLGGGPIRLAMRGQCAISWHQKDLWDPRMAPGANDFQVIRKAIAENRLRFTRETPAERERGPIAESFDGDETGDDIPVLADVASIPEDTDDIEAEALADADDRHRIKIARMIKSQRLRIKSLTSQHESEIEELLRKHRLEVQVYRNQLRELEQTIAQLKVLNDQAKDKLAKRNEQYLLLQNEVSHYRKRFASLEKELARALPVEEAERMRQRMEGELSILREQLDRREAELFYRDEREEQLKAEVAALRDELQGGERHDIVQELAALAVVFVVYHPGAGHITLPARDVRQYVQNPTAYVAERCFVTEEQYLQWLEHYEKPVCTHQDAQGRTCGEVVTRVSVPSDFQPGVSDRCEAHRG